MIHDRLQRKDYPEIIPVWMTSHPVGMMIITFALLCIGAWVADFSTKGEPREALVAVQMLKTGNWILPIDGSGDMAYKPPLFHWLVAIFSLPLGHVTEFTARIPSIISLFILLSVTYKVFEAEKGNAFAILGTVVLFTCFEVLRAGTVARVDMLLTLCIVGAIYAFYYWCVGKSRVRCFCIAIGCMSLGTLTKGPVAILLPTGIIWIWCLLQRRNFFSTSIYAILAVLCSLILPLLWYWSAYEQGGEKFLSLVCEENFGRFAGHMSYDSHVKPLWYNFTSLASGLLPYTILLIITAPFRALRPLYSTLSSPKRLWQSMSPFAKYAIIAAVIILVFYSIPKSKRSVYLLPMYPFIAYGIAVYMFDLYRYGITKVRTLRYIILSAVILMIAGFSIAFPVFTKIDSDRQKAEKISEIVPQGTIYSYYTDRFMRFYITDFYLGGRICSLLPSAQVVVSDDKPDNGGIVTPNAQEYYILTTQDIYNNRGGKGREFYRWIYDNDLYATPVYTSEKEGHDVKEIFVLLHIHQHI